MPKAAYRRILQGPDFETPQRASVKVTAASTVLTNSQIIEPILCGMCEDRFEKWESYAFPVLSQGDGTFPWLASARVVEVRLPDSCRVAESDGIDVAKLSPYLRPAFSGASACRESAAACRLGATRRSFAHTSQSTPPRSQRTHGWLSRCWTTRRSLSVAWIGAL